MAKSRQGMRLRLAPQQLDTSWPCRPIAADDIPALGALMLAAYQGTVDYEGETLDDAIGAARSMLAGRYGPFLERCSFVAEQAGQAAGACIITLWNDRPLVCDIMVHPALKNQGLGTFLLKRSARALFEQGYGELVLYVTVGNDNAQHVYEKLGFQIEEQPA